MEQCSGSKLGKEYNKAIYCHPVYLTSMQTAAAAAKLLQSCPTLCDPIDSSPSGSPVPGILQARTLEWVAVSFSNAWKWKVKLKALSRVQLFATPWTAVHQAPPFMGFSRQQYWSGLPLPSPACEMSAIVRYFEHSLALPFFGIRMKTDLFQSILLLFTKYT